MKIRITAQVPLEAKHGVEIGNEYEAIYDESTREAKDRKFRDAVWIESKVGQLCKIFKFEYEIIRE